MTSHDLFRCRAPSCSRSTGSTVSHPAETICCRAWCWCWPLCPVLLAWVQAAVFGLPYIQPVLPYSESAATGPHGFPVWVRYCHFFNFLFLTMLIRSGLSILMDHPRLYFNNHCTPGTEWIRLSPLSVPTDRMWTAKDDARYISPLAALPGYRHTIGVARSWHFLNVYGFIITGLIFVSLLFSTTQWRTARAHVRNRVRSGVEHVRALRQFPLSA